MQFIIRKPLKALFRYHGNGKLVSIKHHIRIVFKQRTVVRKCCHSADRKLFPVNIKLVSDSDPIIFRIKPVYDDLIFILWEFSIHDADFIDIVILGINTHGMFVFTLYIFIKDFTQFQMFFF